MIGLVEFSVVPIGTAKTSVSEYVKIAYSILKSSSFKFEFHSMGTVVEGDIKEILDMIMEINKIFEKRGIKRVITSVKIDYRIDKISTIQNKIESVVGGDDEQ